MAKSYFEKIQLADSLEKAKQKTQEALMKAGFGPSRWVDQQQAFYAESPVNLWSWGEDILVRFQETNQGTEVHFTSSCKLATQFIDWGKNKKNAKKFINSLTTL